MDTVLWERLIKSAIKIPGDSITYFEWEKDITRNVKTCLEVTSHPRPHMHELWWLPGGFWRERQRTASWREGALKLTSGLQKRHFPGGWEASCSNRVDRSLASKVKFETGETMRVRQGDPRTEWEQWQSYSYGGGEGLDSRVRPRSNGKDLSRELKDSWWGTAWVRPRGPSRASGTLWAGQKDLGICQPPSSASSEATAKLSSLKVAPFKKDSILVTSEEMYSVSPEYSHSFPPQLWGEGIKVLNDIFSDSRTMCHTVLRPHHSMEAWGTG